MWKDWLREAAASAFEEAAFCMVEDVEAGGRDIEGACGIVKFEGPRHGLIMVQTDARTASMATANMLGRDDEPGSELQQDALFEIANMICGNVVSVVGHGAEIFRLTRSSDAPSLDWAPEADMVLILDSGRARVGLWFEPIATEVSG